MNLCAAHPWVYDVKLTKANKANKSGCGSFLEVGMAKNQLEVGMVHFPQNYLLRQSKVHCPWFMDRWTDLSSVYIWPEFRV